MPAHPFDPCDLHSLNVFGDSAIETEISFADAALMLQRQQSLCNDKLRGDENALIEFNGPRAHIPEVGLLVVRSHVAVNNPVLQDAQVEANLAEYDPSSQLDTNDMLRGAWKWEEPIGTCFMVGNRTILTARHNFVPPDCTDLFGGHVYVVFGHSVLPDGKPRRSFTVNKDIFRVIAPENLDLHITAENDWLMLQLEDPDGELDDRPVTPTIKLAECGGDVYTLGHPNGLTLRYSRSRTIQSGSSVHTFRAFLDAYPVASGSPVFDFASDKLLGVIIRGKLGSGRARVKGEQRRVSLVSASGDDTEPSLCVASDVFP